MIDLAEGVRELFAETTQERRREFFGVGWSIEHHRAWWSRDLLAAMAGCKWRPLTPDERAKQAAKLRGRSVAHKTATEVRTHSSIVASTVHKPCSCGGTLELRPGVQRWIHVGPNRCSGARHLRLAP